MAIIIDGKQVSAAIRAELKGKVTKLVETGRPPGLAAVLIGDDPASATYVRSKARACAEVGFYSEVFRHDSEISQAELIRIIEGLNSREEIDGILVQSPLPAGLDEMAVTLAIDPAKDVDGFHPFNVGSVALGMEAPVSCTPAGIQELLKRYEINTSGAEVVIVGRSSIVGRPLATLLSSKGPAANATVTLAHSRTKNLPAVCARADILVAAIGAPQMITAEYVKEGAAVIDVGINRVEDVTRKSGYRLVGDVDFSSVEPRASYITPVPGGVGPMTIAMLLTNAYNLRLNRQS